MAVWCARPEGGLVTATAAVANVTATYINRVSSDELVLTGIYALHVRIKVAGVAATKD